jgi:hypothetical protein
MEFVWAVLCFFTWWFGVMVDACIAWLMLVALSYQISIWQERRRRRRDTGAGPWGSRCE